MTTKFAFSFAFEFLCASSTLIFLRCFTGVLSMLIACTAVSTFCTDLSVAFGSFLAEAFLFKPMEIPMY